MAKKSKKNESYKYSRQELKLHNERQERFEQMVEFKRRLGIDEKCDRLDKLFSPHLTGLNQPDVEATGEDEEGFSFTVDQKLFEEPRKSRPMAFVKIMTAVAVLIQDNPQIIPKPFREVFRKLNLLIEHVYYENWRIARKKRVLWKYIYHLAKYGIAYWREYIKKTYRQEHREKLDKNGNPILDKNGNPVYEKVWVYDVNEEVAENIHPKHIVLDDSCLGPNDVNRPANDLFLHFYYTQKEFEALYPEDKYPNAKYVKEGQGWMVDIPAFEGEKTANQQKKIQVITYENKYEDVREIWANGIPIEIIPLPGHKLSVTGGKWSEDKEDYDGIGIGQILELYQPIVDDILNASLERLRQIVRPNEDWFNGVELADESDDINYGAGNVRKFNGNPSDVVYNSPPPLTAGERAEIQALLDEIDEVTVPKNLAGLDDAKTAFQAAQNREAALRRLSIPLGAIKDTLEDAANIALALYPIIYGEPEEVVVLKPDEDNEDYEEAVAIYNKNPNDERVVKDIDKKTGQEIIYRRRFRTLELPLAIEMDEKGNSTGRVVYSDEKEFWEMVPKHFNWRGRIEIVGESILPVSKTLEEEKKKEMVDFILGIQTTDELGRPVLVDATGKPYTIDKVRAIKDRIAINRNFDPDKYVIPMDEKNAYQGQMPENPLEKKADLRPAEKVTDGGAGRPELRGLKLF